MRFHPKSWNEELWVCSIRGHRTPAALTRTLRVGVDDAFGLEVGRLRLARCIRCDAWVPIPLVNHEPTHDNLLSLQEMMKPRRGRVLEDAITMKVIALWRGAHAVVFLVAAILIAVIRTNLAGWKESATSLIEQITRVIDETGRTSGTNFLLSNLEKVSRIKGGTITVLLLTMLAYAALEGAEGVGLWLERRWAEYLTVIATALLLPLEIHELTKRVTVFRVGAFVANIAVLVFLVWTKRLFGIRGGAHHEDHANWEKIIAETPPTGRELSLLPIDLK